MSTWYEIPEGDGPKYTSFGEDSFSWNVGDGECDDGDGTGRPGANMVGSSIVVWMHLQRGEVTVAQAALAWNLSPDMVIAAVEDTYLGYIQGKESGDFTKMFIEQDGI